MNIGIGFLHALSHCEYCIVQYTDLLSTLYFYFHWAFVCTCSSPVQVIQRPSWEQKRWQVTQPGHRLHMVSGSVTLYTTAPPLLWSLSPQNPALLTCVCESYIIVTFFNNNDGSAAFLCISKSWSAKSLNIFVWKHECFILKKCIPFQGVPQGLSYEPGNHGDTGTLSSDLKAGFLLLLLLVLLPSSDTLHKLCRRPRLSLCPVTSVLLMGLYRLRRLLDGPMTELNRGVGCGAQSQGHH